MQNLSRSMRAALTLAACGALTVAAPGVATAAPPDGKPAKAAKAAKPAKPAKPANGECGRGRGVPDSKISIQLWTFAEYIGFGSDAATQARLEEVLATLAEIGYRNVEPFTFNGLSAEEFEALLKKYGLKVPTRHGSTNEANWDDTLADARTLNQKFVGSGGAAAPGISTYEDTLATAETLNRLGERSVRNGTGKIFVHNHQGEFTTTYEDPATGETKTAWEILVENTDRRYVTFQLDVAWAADAGVDVVDLIEEHGKRIQLLHIKDAVNIDAPGNASPVPLGEGEVDFEEILEAAHGKVRYYTIEQDPVFGGEADNMLDEAATSFRFLDCITY